MDKRKLSKIPRPEFPEIDNGLIERLPAEIKHIVTSTFIDDEILILNFFEKKSRNPVMRTFFTDEDYITQDLTQSKTKWITSGFYSWTNTKLDVMLTKSSWNRNEWTHKECVFVASDFDKQLIDDFFMIYAKDGDDCAWEKVYRYQEHARSVRRELKYKKETDPIDAIMEPIKDVPEAFEKWVFENAFEFSRYLIYQEVKSGEAECECTYCKKIGLVSRKEVRMRNNEKGVCPFCGSKVTFKAKGKLPSHIWDQRWIAYIDPTDDGFLFRYFHAHREVRKHPDTFVKKDRTVESMGEFSRAFYTFENGVPKCDSYEWAEFKQSGRTRWCHDEGKIACMECVLYPENLPEAWEHTPMKYSALEFLSRNIPTVTCRYEDGIKGYIEFPKLEWFCKMGLNKLAQTLINKRHYGSTGKINTSGKTIYDILGLNKVNTKILQEIDGNTDCLRLLQVAQQIGVNFKPEQLQEYYETFECNTTLLKQANRKVSLHKLVKYITKESERYPLGERGGCYMYSYMRYQEREDPRIERKQNMAKDWLEYLDWCKELKYDLDNMFIYMPKNFKKVHDRTAEEYQALQDKKAAEEKKRQEALARKRMEKMKKAMEELFKRNGDSDAFAIKGKGLVIVVPKTGAEIKAEGEKLHHCVGGYVDRVARGETNIFFVRKSESPDVPYFTMEFKNNKIVQCRGSHNCGMPPEVEAFVKVFEKKMQAASADKKAEKKQRKAG
ncbi:MAG: PcfJ domain-containing protein [Hespellia sp.]|nr:PcfJ domain-containing protein [Hespellia sp.]